MRLGGSGDLRRCDAGRPPVKVKRNQGYGWWRVIPPKDGTTRPWLKLRVWANCELGAKQEALMYAGQHRAQYDPYGLWDKTRAERE